MFHRLGQKVLASLGLVGLAMPTASVGQNSGFGSAADAERYLEENPTGPRAAEAFRFLVYQGLGDKYPDFDGTPTTRNIAPVPQQPRAQQQQQQPRQSQATPQDDDDDDRSPATTY